MTTSKPTVISSTELATVAGSGGTGFGPAGRTCAPDTRNRWQMVAPTWLGGKPDPACTSHPGRVWFSKDALDGAPVGQRQFSPDAKRDISNLAGKL